MAELESISQGLAWFILAGYFVLALEFFIGNRTIRELSEIPSTLPPTPPRVSIIAAARNEEKGIEQALQSLLYLDYPDYEIILLNDRSTDQTGPILECMRKRYPQLKVVHIETLPEGWLGKNHALYVGSREASGELLLFTDADIVFDPTALSRAVHYMQNRGVDHLVAVPHLEMPGLWLNLFSVNFSVNFALYSRPWRAKQPKSRAHIGVGAFNLIRKSVYEKIGTHQAIAMRPDDDMKLGKLVKKYGFREDVVFGSQLITVEWYSSLKEAVNGLMKNAFAGLEYSVPVVIAGVLAQFLFNVWPFIAVWFSEGQTQMVYLAAFLLILSVAWDNARFHNISPWYALGFPLANLLIIYILLRSMFLTLKNNGIDWRGTHYPLAALKANRV